MGVFLDNLDVVREVEWARSYLWDVKLEGLPAPFSNWFPAQSVELPYANIISHSFEHFISSYSVPKAMEDEALSITFYDDAKFSIADFITKWINTTILNDGKAVSTLMDEGVCKNLFISRLTPERQKDKLFLFLVYPEGPLVHNFESGGGEALLTTVSFKVVGHVFEEGH